MSAGYYHECDQCRKLERAGCDIGEVYRPAGWFTVIRHKQLHEQVMPHVDVCSFACLVAYGQQHGWNEVTLQGTRTPTGGVAWDTKELKMTMEPV